jgi:hypothetical protein
MNDGTRDLRDNMPIFLADDMTEAELTETAEVAREHAADARQSKITADWVARSTAADDDARETLRAWHAENQRLGL